MILNPGFCGLGVTYGLRLVLVLSPARGLRAAYRCMWPPVTARNHRRALFLSKATSLDAFPYW
jgi:hypothetical protein